MDSKIELVKVIDDSRIIVRTKNDKLADNYWLGKVFLEYEGKAYYCQDFLITSTQDVDGWNVMRMVTDE